MNKEEIRKKIGEIIDEYASMVDDDSVFFVKPEVRNKYLDRIMSVLSESKGRT